MTNNLQAANEKSFDMVETWEQTMLCVAHDVSKLQF